MALLDLQGMVSENGGGGGNSSLSLLCHSSHSITICPWPPPCLETP